MQSNGISVNDCLIELYCSNSDYEVFCEMNASRSSVFAKYISEKFDNFIKIIESIDKNELSSIILTFDDFKGKKTVKRFINLMSNVCNILSGILKDCYKSNQSIALNKLERLLDYKVPKVNNYLDDYTLNYFYKININDTKLFRMRDEAADNCIDNCWHTPFYMREKSYSGRYSLPGFPCLYLGDSAECCNKEIGKLKKKNIRYVGEFIIPKGSDGICCLDLRNPSKSEIEKMEDNDKIKSLITYPLRLLCTTPHVHKSDQFCEEYLFSNCLIALITNPTKEDSGIYNVDGVMYDSTVYPGGINFALPAKSESIPPSASEQFSNRLQQVFIHDKPKPYKTKA